MSSQLSDAQPALPVTETTFSSYDQNQGKAYAHARPDYDPGVYKAIINHHKSTGGQFDTVVDVGCGPGSATRGLAPYFTNAIGLDPSQGMVATARSFGGVSSASRPIRDSSVDLITAANAAHWFDMPKFWLAAARILKPGGTVALWTSGEIRVHPSMPNAAALQAVFDEHTETYLKPFHVPGNYMVRSGYADLGLPWSIAQPVEAFDKESFVRKDWPAGEKFVVGESEVDLDTFEKIIGSGSPPTRWRQAHPEAVGTENDVVRILRRKIERVLRESGVEEGKERMRGTIHGVMLFVKKSA
ncbi:methyltransferase domain-containing protein [Trichoderma breve]|uniref:Methyltransferase domain-containing protein n=1 Tax=Trichoderma breve TaxID=2034170 RepID=A0A9W9E6W8_9HYPO|nr:methyltransferase domain-containing protein [Trichoderma breve]KAJ4861258.1 methyltransferase domain-containing protein [Trichoderma breve]